MAYRDQPLGELALSIPRASALFRKYDMDYCCGGKQTLARAAARKELDVDVIEAELAKLAEQPIEKDWRSAPLAEIIDHIIVRYHDRHREQLPELILQATKVERVHADKPSVPKGLTKYLTMLHEELSSHMMKEEQILFPMIKQGMDRSKLFIEECYASNGPIMKRVQPRAQGRAYRIEKRMSHITLVLNER